MPELPTPELRPGPPWVMEDMIAAEPALARAVLADVEPAERIAGAVVGTLTAGGSVVVTGCGTSEHAALGIAELLGRAVRGRGLPGHRIAARQAFEAWLEPWPGSLVIGVSHEAETEATILALTAARDAGGSTVLITANGEGPAARAADMTLVTPRLDSSWCHTVGYLSPILAGGAIAAAVGAAGGQGRDPRASGHELEALLWATLALALDAERVASFLTGITQLVACGSGADRGLARELALKVEEGAWIAAVGRDLETQLHGHLVAAEARTGLVVLVTDPAERERRAGRAATLLAAAARLGIRSAAIVAPGVADAWPDALTPAGRLVTPDTSSFASTDLLPPLIAGAVALQLLAVGIIHAAGTNPDRIRRQHDPWRLAAEDVAATRLA